MWRVGTISSFFGLAANLAGVATVLARYELHRRKAGDRRTPTRVATFANQLVMEAASTAVQS